MIPSLSKVQHVVMICKQYAGANEVIFANGEEELFVDLAELQFDYEVSRWRKMLVFKASVFC